jgi:hypothetical protein
VNLAAVEKLPERTGDKSGIGVHYVDAYVKAMNVNLEDGTAVKCKRRGLKIVLSAGSKKGEGLMRGSTLALIRLSCSTQHCRRHPGPRASSSLWKTAKFIARFDPHLGGSNPPSSSLSSQSPAEI